MVQIWGVIHLEVTAGFEPADNGVADRGLTTWLWRRIQNVNIISRVGRFVNAFWEILFYFLLRKMKMSNDIYN